MFVFVFTESCVGVISVRKLTEAQFLSLSFELSEEFLHTSLLVQLTESGLCKANENMLSSPMN